MYLVYEGLYGDLQDECGSTYIAGLYANRADAVKKAKELIEADMKLNNYVLDESNNDIESGFARLFWDQQDNWNCYYEIEVKEMKVIK